MADRGGWRAAWTLGVTVLSALGLPAAAISAPLSESAAAGATVIDVPFENPRPPAPVPGAAATIVAVTPTDLRHMRYDWVISALPAALLDAPITVHFPGQQFAARASNDIAQTLADGLRGQLAAQGYRIGGDHVRVRVELIRFYATVPPAAGLALCEKLVPPSFAAIPSAALLVKVSDAADRLVFANYYAAERQDAFGCADVPLLWLQPLWQRYRAGLIAVMGDVVAAVIADPNFQNALQQAMASGAGHAP